MKRIVLLVGLLALKCAELFAQESIAVFPFEDLDKVFTRNEYVMFYREFSNEFTNKNAGKFKIVPRQEVEKLINTEAAFQLSDFSAKAKTAEMQRVLNGTQILSGVIGKVGSRISISVSLYNYPELQQLPGGTSLRVTNIDELFDKIPELVKNMQEVIIANQPPKVYKIGDKGPGGGFVFFAENGIYMECSMDLGTFNWDDAIRAARNHRGGGFTDWKLPSQSELDLMYKNLKSKSMGGFGTSAYWSSSQLGSNYAWGQYFSSGNQNNFTKVSTYSVRAIRSF
ncbi:MAG: DUF1566 domain-containing protein [Treponema sp.]|nr:DUF1566 domain-containing protein [Treponema sp.]